MRVQVVRERTEKWWKEARGTETRRKKKNKKKKNTKKKQDPVLVVGVVVTRHCFLLFVGFLSTRPVVFVVRLSVAPIPFAVLPVH